MMLIVMHHAVMYSNVLITDFVDYKISKIIEMGGKLGVNIFVLISAYFMVTKKFSWKRIFNIILQTFIVSVVIYFIFLIAGETTFSFKNIIHNLFPVLFGNWWFVTSYVVLLLVSPGLNLIIKNISQKQHKIICCASVLVMIIVPYINLYLLKGDFVNFLAYNDTIWFIILYFVAAYFRLYKINVNKLIIFLIFIFGYLYQILDTVLTRWVFEIYCPNTLGNSVTSISLFLLFKDFKFKNKFINAVASTTFGIYLIHEHNLIRSWWWEKIFWQVQTGLNNYLLTFLTISLITFIGCAIVYFIYLKLVYKWIDRGLNVFCLKFSKCSENKNLTEFSN